MNRILIESVSLAALLLVIASELTTWVWFGRKVNIIAINWSNLGNYIHWFHFCLYWFASKTYMLVAFCQSCISLWISFLLLFILYFSSTFIYYLSVVKIYMFIHNSFTLVQACNKLTAWIIVGSTSSLHESVLFLSVIDKDCSFTWLWLSK